MTRLTIIAAVARNGVIGHRGGMPWHLPGELAQFKATTLGHTLVMGRATFDSIGRALPGRRTIVITRNPTWHHAGVETAHSFADALALAGPGDEVFAAGGAQIYELALPFAQRLVITEVAHDAEGSVTFPASDAGVWVETSRTEHDGLAFVDYELRRR